MPKSARAILQFCVCVAFVGAGVLAQAGVGASQLPPSVVHQLAKLSPSDGETFESFGTSVAISGDTVVVGINNESAVTQNTAYVFVKPASGWADAVETAQLTPSDGTTGDRFGISVAISGNTIFVGSSHFNQFAAEGAIYVFVEPAGGWASMTETAKLSAGTAFGRIGLQIAAGGNTVISSTVAQGGQVAIWDKPVAGWTNKGPDATLTTSDGANNFGSTLAMSVTGDTILAFGQAQRGLDESLVYVFVRPPTGWRGKNITQTAELITSDGLVNDDLGLSIGISGSTVAAGAPGYNSGTGAVYVYVKPASGWVNMHETAVMVAFGAPFLGESVAVSGSTIVGGSPFANVGGNLQQGAAFVYRKPVSGWTSTSGYNAMLTAADGVELDNFATSVAMSGSTIVVGAPFVSSGSNTQEGAAYVFGQ